MRSHFLLLATLAMSATIAACDSGSLARWTGGGSGPPDSLPKLLNDSLPFDYPISYYLNLIDDSVTLRLRVDTTGRAVPESTRVEVHAKYPAFDTAALDGAAELRFRPAMRRGKPMPYSVLFPILFKVPSAPVVTPAPDSAVRSDTTPRPDSTAK